MLLRITLLLFLGVKLAASAEAASLRINEVLASNRSGALDDTGNTSDWVELHNEGSELLRLAKFQLSDGNGKPSAWVLPNAPAALPVVFLRVCFAPLGFGPPIPMAGPSSQDWARP